MCYELVGFWGGVIDVIFFIVFIVCEVWLVFGIIY